MIDEMMICEYLYTETSLADASVNAMVMQTWVRKQKPPAASMNSSCRPSGITKIFRHSSSSTAAENV